MVSEEPVDDLDLSEAEVIRRIFRMAAEEQQSCPHIADYLNALACPVHLRWRDGGETETNTARTLAGGAGAQSVNQHHL